VVERSHAVEQVGSHPCSGGYGVPSHVVARIGVPDRRYGAGIDDAPDCRQRTLQFGSQGDHADGPAAGAEQPVGLKKVGRRRMEVRPRAGIR